MRIRQRKWGRTPLLAGLTFGLCAAASASPYAVSQSSLGVPDVTFDEVALGTLLNGLTIDGFTFAETGPGNTTVTSSGGPGNTNSITQPSALSFGNSSAEIITVTMPGLSYAFGFGYAVLFAGTLADAVTITLFDGATNLGSLGFVGSSDPSFTGGFAAIGNDTPFTSAQIAFSTRASAFDIDNISVNGVPEPATFALLGLGLAGLGFSRRKQ